MTIKKKEIPKEILIQLYVNEKKSCKDIAKLYNTTIATVKARLVDNDITVRNMVEACALRLERYGSPRVRGSVPWNKGIHRTLQEKEHISIARKGISGLVGDKHPQWKGGISLSKRGYISVCVSPDSPFISMASSNHNKGYRIAQHRLVMAQTIGRSLSKEEIVHHLNGIKNDNRPENLVIVTRHAHETKTFIRVLQREIRRLQLIIDNFKSYGLIQRPMI
jgi:hypothetical protein